MVMVGLELPFVPFHGSDKESAVGAHWLRWATQSVIVYPGLRGGGVDRAAPEPPGRGGEPDQLVVRRPPPGATVTIS